MAVLQVFQAKLLQVAELMATRRAREQPSSQAPKVQMLKCLCFGCSFNKNAYILTKIALSSSLSRISKYGSACPASEQCTAAAHTSYSHASNDQATMSVHERLESYSGNLPSATQRVEQICPEDWFASVDLKDAYFHIQIAPHHRRFLRFAFEGTAY